MKKIRSVFKRIANWPIHPQWLVLRHRDKHQREAVSQIKCSVLDVGCAHQEIRQYLSDDQSYFGLDYPGTAINMYGTKPTVFADGQQLPFKGESVDTVLLMDVAEHLPDPEACITEIYRVLENGGRLVIDVPFMYPVHDAPYDFHRWTEHGLLKMLEQAGFQIVESKHCGNTISSGSLLCCLGLSEMILNRIEQNPLWYLVTPLIVVPILIANLIGGLSELFSKSPTRAPYGYRFIACK